MTKFLASINAPAARCRPLQVFRTGRPRTQLAARRHQLVPCRASAEAEQLLVDGSAKYNGGDRMGALRLWEQALQQNPTQDQRLAALYNAACVHASFGDLELAQIPLKDAIFSGLDFSAALNQQDPRFVKMRASAQILIQLRKFNDSVLRAKSAGTTPPPAFNRSRAGAGGAATASSSSSSASSSSSSSRGGIGGVLGRDVSDVLSTDAEGIDTSIGGIIKRVVVLLLALSGLGTALFYLGLKFAFPDSPY